MGYDNPRQSGDLDARSPSICNARYYRQSSPHQISIISSPDNRRRPDEAAHLAVIVRASLRRLWRVAALREAPARRRPSPRFIPTSRLANEPCCAFHSPSPPSTMLHRSRPRNDLGVVRAETLNWRGKFICPRLINAREIDAAATSVLTMRSGRLFVAVFFRRASCLAMRKHRLRLGHSFRQCAVNSPGAEPTATTSVDATAIAGHRPHRPRHWPESGLAVLGSMAISRGADALFSATGGERPGSASNLADLMLLRDGAAAWRLAIEGDIYRSWPASTEAFCSRR